MSTDIARAMETTGEVLVAVDKAMQARSALAGLRPSLDKARGLAKDGSAKRKELSDRIGKKEGCGDPDEQDDASTDCCAE